LHNRNTDGAARHTIDDRRILALQRGTRRPARVPIHEKRSNGIAA